MKNTILINVKLTVSFQPYFFPASKFKYLTESNWGHRGNQKFQENNHKSSKLKNSNKLLMLVESTNKISSNLFSATELGLNIFEFTMPE